MDRQFRHRLQRDRHYPELRFGQALPDRRTLQPGTHRNHRDYLGRRDRQGQGAQIRLSVQAGITDGLL